MTSYKDFENITITPWIPVSKIPSTGFGDYEKLVEQYGEVGVYQVAETKDVEAIGKDLVHEDIGYTGKSTSVLSRTYSIRAPSGDHGASRYIRQNNLDRETDVMIRYIYCTQEQYTALENDIHKETSDRYGYRFKWTDASAGNTGNASMAIDLANKLTSEQILDMIVELKKIAIQKNQQEFLERLKEV
jgi:hypothetical protein